MVFYILSLIVCGILAGISIGFLLAQPVIRQKISAVQTYWEQQLIAANKNWSDFHKAESDKWIEKTRELVHKTYHETVEERDRAWQKKFNGTKPKPKPPN